MFPHCPSYERSKNVLSFFLRHVISDAGANWDISAVAPRSHSVRSVVTSAAFLHNWSVSKLLEAATRRSNLVFTLFYFKDLSFTLNDCSSHGPFVAAGLVVS